MKNENKILVIQNDSVVNRIDRNTNSSIFQTVILKLFFLLILLIGKIAHINAFEDSKNHLRDSSVFCTIGRLRMCNEDEDCVELDHQDLHKNYNQNNYSIGQLSGVCMCRDLTICERKHKFSNIEKPKSDQLSGRDRSSHSSYSNSHTQTIIFIILTALIVGGFGSFAIYYYGIRYGMIRHFARRFGLTNQNTQIEDNQLLNQIEINRGDDGDEITI